MARPRKNNAEYFSHDANMRSDRKIIALRSKFWLEGYAIWNMLLETLAWAENFTVSYSPMEIELLAGDFGIDAEVFDQIVRYMAKINLFALADEVITCPKLIERLEPLLNKRKRYRERTEWVSDDQNYAGESGDEVMDNQNEVLETETIVSEEKTPQSKVQHRKVKKRKQKKKNHSRDLGRAWKIILNLTPDQRKELTDEYWESMVKRYERKLFNYITSKGDRYDSHYHTLLVWFDKDNIKPSRKANVMHFDSTPMSDEQRKHAKKWLLEAKQKLMTQVSD